MAFPDPTQWTITSNFTTPVEGGAGDWWLDEQYVDFSDPTTRAKFINSDATWVYLGYYGDVITTGVYPLVWNTVQAGDSPSDFTFGFGQNGGANGWDVTATGDDPTTGLPYPDMSFDECVATETDASVSGASGTGAAGTPANMSDTASIASAFGMGEAGTPNIGSDWSMVIAGVGSTGTANTASDEIDVPIMGVAGPGETGSTPRTETDILVTGVGATGAAGNTSIEVDCLIIVGADAEATGFADEIEYLATGVETDGQVGTLQTETDGFGTLSGVEGDSAVDASAEIDIPITGVEGDSAAGVIAAFEIDHLVTGIAGTGVAASLLIKVDDEGSIIGVFGTGIKGHPIADVGDGPPFVGVTATGAAGAPSYFELYCHALGVSTSGQLGNFIVSAKLNPRPRVLIMSY